MISKLSALLGVFLILTSFNTQEGYHVGDIARDFSLKNIDGQMVSLESLGARGYVVVFTCNHCPFAKKYEERLVKLNNITKPKGYPVVAINPNDVEQYPEDSFENMKIRAAEKGFNFPYLYDESQEIARAYGATKTPHVFLLQKIKGEFVVQYIGAIDDNTDDEAAVKIKYVENAVDALIQGNPIEPSSTKAIGCSIKWKK
ncbi:MAG: thioredoxin family protein [Bacteroidia bacterium]